MFKLLSYHKNTNPSFNAPPYNFQNKFRSIMQITVHATDYVE